jgi:hypothetical protein
MWAIFTNPVEYKIVNKFDGDKIGQFDFVKYKIFMLDLYNLLEGKINVCGFYQASKKDGFYPVFHSKRTFGD